MNSIARILITGTLSLTIFVNCAPRGQSPAKAGSQTTVPGASAPGTPSGVPGTPPPVGPPGTSQGTMDSGGGNTLLGRPLDSYVVALKDLEAFKSGVQPLLEIPALKDSELKRQIDATLTAKTWYLVPSELSKLPAAKIASAVGTEQAALQDFHQVWLDKNIFEKMTAKDQAVLILHEILMGLKLSKISDGKPSDLTTQDYAEIRAVTKKLSDDGKAMSLDQWEILLLENNFFKNRLRPSKAKTKITFATLGQWIEQTKLMKSWPKYGYDFTKFLHHSQLLTGKKIEVESLASDQECNYDVEVANNRVSVSLKESEKQKTFFMEFKDDWEISAGISRDNLTGMSFNEVHLSKLAMNYPLKKGDEVLMMDFKFMGPGLLQAATLIKAYCVNDDCSSWGTGLQNMHQLCYMTPTLNLKQSAFR